MFGFVVYVLFKLLIIELNYNLKLVKEINMIVKFICMDLLK